MTRKEVTKIVHDYPIEEVIGFTSIEQTLLLNDHFSDMDVTRYYGSMLGNTCMVIEGQTRTYHCDVITGIMCALEDRDMTYFEWD